MKRIWKNRTAETPKPADLFEQILKHRGVVDGVTRKKFLEASFSDTYDPFLLKDMDKAADRVLSAIANKEKITVYADYDADAVTAAAVLVRFFKQLGHENLNYYIPDRFSEGYGINREAVKVLSDSGTNLIITVDCGINAIEPALEAKLLGVDVIITDHHRLTGPLPEALAVVNPHRPADEYPCKDLTGVGVAFKLVQALVFKIKNQKLKIKNTEGWEKWLLDLVAIGTVADCQSLLGENRIFVKWGLRVLEKTKWPGLRDLLKVAGVWESPLDTYKIGFIIAPRINAAGRIEHANLALELVLTDDLKRARELAQKLDDLNRKRQELTETVLSEAREQLVGDTDKKILLAAGDNWPKGIVGLVAGKLTEEFARPVLVMEKGVSEATGSARSVGNFNIIEAISQSREILIKFGGHPMAAGFTLRSEHIELFHKNLLEYAEDSMDEEDLSPILFYDGEAVLPDVTEDLVNFLEQLAPFGLGNPRPRVRINNLTPRNPAKIGSDGRHLRLYVGEGEHSFSCIGFNQGFWVEKLQAGSQIDIICEPQFNEWNGERKVQLKIIDICESQNLSSG